jgi:hypothetical protein
MSGDVGVGGSRAGGADGSEAGFGSDRFHATGGSGIAGSFFSASHSGSTCASNPEFQRRGSTEILRAARPKLIWPILILPMLMLFVSEDLPTIRGLG